MTRVLVVDDSAFARKVLREILASDPEIEVVGTARDGVDALEKIAELKPDVVTLDLVMPTLDGLGVLAAMPPGPRVVVVTSADAESEMVIQALLAGAITALHKPTALATDRLYEIAREIVDAVKRAAGSHPPTTGPIAPARVAAAPGSRRQILAIGGSTGGPHAATRLLTALPPTLSVPIAVVIHLPIGYTDAFASRLNDVTGLPVAEATDGMPLLPGRVVVGRAGLHLKIARGPAGLVARLDPLPLDRPHRPSVDELFASAADATGSGALGVVLTGMGDDGLAGARRIVGAGGSVLTQAAASCAVYGMPRSVAEAGLSEAEVDLEGMAEAIVARL